MTLFSFLIKLVFCGEKRRESSAGQVFCVFRLQMIFHQSCVFMKLSLMLHEADVFVDVRLTPGSGPSSHILFYVPQQSRVSLVSVSVG